jgi:predicted DNA-binding protein YlxM (UPF0122 family)
MKERLVTIKEFADKHNVSPQAIRYQIKQGHLNCVIKFGLQLIDFKNEIVKSFVFEKVNKNWHLKNSNRTNFSNLPDLDFINFLIKFSNDSIFQIKSISFPLKESFADTENDYEITTKSIKQYDWKFWKLTNDINQLLILADIQIDNKYRNIFFRGVENGILMKYIFERINGNWKLIKLEDYST